MAHRYASYAGCQEVRVPYKPCNKGPELLVNLARSSGPWVATQGPELKGHFSAGFGWLAGEQNSGRVATHGAELWLGSYPRSRTSAGWVATQGVELWLGSYQGMGHSGQPAKVDLGYVMGCA